MVHPTACPAVGVAVKQVRGLPPGTLTLIIGSAVTGLRPQPSPSPSPLAAVAGLGKSYGAITGNASCNSDASAFTGPLSPGPQHERSTGLRSPSERAASPATRGRRRPNHPQSAAPLSPRPGREGMGASTIDHLISGRS
jgi:hypothetical protein